METVEFKESKQLSSAIYFKQENKMQVCFTNGSVYEYTSVPESIFDGLKTAESAGKYLNSEVKGKYEYSRIK